VQRGCAKLAAEERELLIPTAGARRHGNRRAVALEQRDAICLHTGLEEAGSEFLQKNGLFFSCFSAVRVWLGKSFGTHKIKK
jgi:hypothetical protein